MPPDIRQFNKRVLLTAAGFSRNWGGYVAKEVWEEIFSHPDVQKRPSLRTLLLRTPMFEDALAQITDAKTFDDQDRAVMQLAVQQTFQPMDDEHAATLSSSAARIDSSGGIMEFFARFYSPIDGVGYIFSLNQDALAERLAGLWVGVPFAVPGIQYLPSTSPLPLGTPPLVAPAKPNLGNMRLDGNLNYIKLHGSFYAVRRMVHRAWYLAAAS